VSVIRTVLGDIDPSDLGVCDAHDHLFLASPALPGAELDDPGAARVELEAFAALGGRAVAQWTPRGMGRRLDDVVALSRRTGVHVIAATGIHQAKHYGSLPEMDRLASHFVHELTAAPVRAGMIKVAGAYHRLDDHARLTMAAAAVAHHATGAPIGVHLEGGTAAMDVLDWLCDRHGVPPSSVILGHAHRFPDSRVHRSVASAGAYLGFDGPARVNHQTDWRLLDIIAALVDAGHAGRLLLGGDTVTANARSTADGPGMPFLLSHLRPRISCELGDDVARALLVDNPARAFAASFPQMT
jgi:5-phospho-D-xylono-1,4-lactonase